MKRFLSLLLAAMMLLALCGLSVHADEAPIKITIYYSDNSTLPLWTWSSSLSR